MRAAVSLFRRLRAAQPSPSPFTAYRPLSSTRLFSSSASPALRSHPPCAPSLRPLPYPRRPLTQRLPDPRRPSHLRTARRRPYSTATSQPPPNPPPPPQSLSLSQRLRKLSREYGWAAFGVYMALSALDFPFSFLAVRWLGTERIGRAEQAVTAWVKRATPVQIPEPWREWWRESMKGWKGEKERAGQVVAVGETGVGAEGYDHGVREAEAANRGEDASAYIAAPFLTG